MRRTMTSNFSIPYSTSVQCLILWQFCINFVLGFKNVCTVLNFGRLWKDNGNSFYKYLP